MKTRIWHPSDGDCLQGDVILFRVPDRITIDLTDEISPRGNRLILAEGEITGHHHAIWLPTMLRDDGAGILFDGHAPLLCTAYYWPNVHAMTHFAGPGAANVLRVGAWLVAPEALAAEEDMQRRRTGAEEEEEEEEEE